MSSVDAYDATTLFATPAPFVTPATTQLSEPGWTRCGTRGCSLQDRHPSLDLFDKPTKGRRSAAPPTPSTRSTHRKSSTARARPQCGTWGCTLPDRHPGLHNLDHLPSFTKRPRVTRGPLSPQHIATSSLCTNVRLGTDFQATLLPTAGQSQSIDRGDVLLNPPASTSSGIFVNEAVASDAWRIRMHTRYASGERDAGCLEEDALHACYHSRPTVGEIALLQTWRTSSLLSCSVCVVSDLALGNVGKDVKR